MNMDKKTAILNTALKLFIENGFHGTATAKIAKDAGVANGTMFLYFPTKDQLIQELYLDIKEQLNHALFAEYNDLRTLKDRFHHIFQASVHWALVNVDGFKYIQMVHNSPYINQIDEGTLHKYINTHLQLIEEATKQNIFKNYPADFLFSLTSNHIFGLNQYLSKGNFTQTQQEEFIKEAFDLLWDMLTI
jgi:AcrR family transcriptional regulator